MDRHSDSGILKAHWTGADYTAMRFHRLAFAEEDVRLIRRAAARSGQLETQTAGSAAPQSESISTAFVPLKIARGHVLVDQVYVNGAGPFRFLVDTGAETSSIRTNVAESLGLRMSYRVELDSTRGKRWVPAGVAKNISLGNHSAVQVDHSRSRRGAGD
jgi:predicted aspartyl protease